MHLLGDLGTLENDLGAKVGEVETLWFCFFFFFHFLLFMVEFVSLDLVNFLYC